jgi:hypothetical protein
MDAVEFFNQQNRSLISSLTGGAVLNNILYESLDSDALLRRTVSPALRAAGIEEHRTSL